MYKEEVLLGSKEFVALLEYDLIDLSELIRKASVKSEKNRFGTAILIGKYLQYLGDPTDDTNKRIKGILRRFCLVFGELDPRYITKEIASYWIRHEGWACSTQEWVALIIERMYRFGANDGSVWTNTMKGLQVHVMQMRRGAHQ